MRTVRTLTVWLVAILLLVTPVSAAKSSSDTASEDAASADTASASSEDTESGDTESAASGEEDEDEDEEDEEEVIPLPELLIQLCDTDEDGELSEEEIEDVTELDLSDRSLVSLEGIEIMTSLTALDLSYNRITDLTPLSSLTGLTALNLYGNYNLTSAEPLANLPMLQQLSITYDKKNGFPVLSSLTVLYLDGTGQTAIDYLTAQPSLRSLILVNSRASDFSILAECYPNLEQLAFRDCTSVNIGNLTGMTGVTELAISGTTVVGTENFASMTGLISLELTNAGVSDLSVLDPLVRLVILSLEDDDITDLTPLQNHTALQALSITSTGVEELPYLSMLTLLTPDNTTMSLPKISLQTARRMLPENLTNDETWMRTNFDTADSPAFYRISAVCLGAGVALIVLGTIHAGRIRRKQKQRMEKIVAEQERLAALQKTEDTETEEKENNE